jgi:hypothetical protein
VDISNFPFGSIIVGSAFVVHVHKLKDYGPNLLSGLGLAILIMFAFILLITGNEIFLYFMVPFAFIIMYICKKSERKEKKEIPIIKPVKILFLGANPKNTTRLRLGEEVRAIDQELHDVKYRDQFDIEQHWAVQVVDLQELLLRHEPDIVHFSGHGTDESEIIVENSRGNCHPISIRALSRLFSILKDNIKCVILNACYSEQQARAIAESIDCVIGMSNAIKDSDAINFSKAFYCALGYGKDVKTAFKLGCLQIEMELGEQDTPKLIAERCDPGEIVFVSDVE